jgi:uncharacterized membrane protein
MYNNYSRPTSLGIDERWERVLAYAFWWVSGLILLFVEQQNETVRRHAKQSLIVFGVLSGLLWLSGLFGTMFGAIPLIGPVFGFGFGLIHGLLWVVAIGLWLLMMVMAYLSPKTLFVGPRLDRML